MNKKKIKDNLLKAVKQAILQEAIQGKLTAVWRAQHPEPVEGASELLKRIKAEKEKLIIEKKIRKEKPLPPITEEEIPFELPEGWVWCRLGEITNYGSSEKIEPNKINPNTWVLDLEDIKKDSSKISRKVLFKERPSTSTKSVFKKNWVLYSKLRPYLDKVVVPDEDGVCTTEILPLPVHGDIVPHFLMYSMKRKDFLDYVNSKVSGMKMPRLRTEDGRKALIPLPPLAEQKAIIEKVEKLMQQAEAISQGANPDDFEIVDKKAHRLLKNYGTIKNILDEITKQKEYVTTLKQSILQEAIQGKQTADWRTKNSPPLEGWQTQSDGVVIKRNAKNYFSLPYNPKLKQRAKELRKAGNLAEVLFWNQVKQKKFLGLDFDRQKIIGNYIVDFYCPNNQVVIEIDGSSHDNKQEYDAKRDAYLKELGLEVIHIKDIDVKKNISGVFEYLRNHKAFQYFINIKKDKQHVLVDINSKGVYVPPRSSTTPPKEGNWEPASELLKRIKAEKEKLIKEKKIKKEKPLPPITEEEIPFELPEGWIWCRLQDSFDVRDGTHNTPKYVEKGIPLVTSKNLYTGKLDLSNTKYISLNDHLEISKRSKVERGDILLAMIGSIGNPVIVDIQPNFSIKNVALIKYYSQSLANPYYIKYFLETVTKQFIKEARGGVQPFISLRKLRETLFPLPPLAEQKVIVEKVESLMQKVSSMEEEIQKSEQNAQMLMQAVLKEAFEGKKEES